MSVSGEYITFEINGIEYEFHKSRYEALVSNGAIEFDEDLNKPFLSKTHKFSYEDVVNFLQCCEPIEESAD